MSETRLGVQEYYGKTLQSSDDLKTNACCTVSKRKSTQGVRDAIHQLHDEVVSKYYGCGLVFPEAVEGCRIVDLGSGSGRDCYILSKLVGPTGYVTGVDMTKEQLQVARNHIDYHMKQFGYQTPNVSFLEGYIEDLIGCGIPRDSVDIIVSNCVINLCPNKQTALQEAYNILKSGGEMYFSDIYADKDLPPEVRRDKILYGECIGGALVWTDLMKIACEVGFAPPVLVDVSPITIDKPELKQLIGNARFCSATYRLFKVEPDDSNPSDTVIEVVYKGSIPDHPNEFNLSHDITISKCCPTFILASVAQLLMDSRLAPHFTFKASSSSSSSYANLSDFIHINPFEIMDKGGDTDKGGGCTSSSCC